jgi:hypothetical protein
VVTVHRVVQAALVDMEQQVQPVVMGLLVVQVVEVI